MNGPTIEQLIEEEYLQHDINEDEELYWWKEGLKNALNQIERKIFITYLEQGTYAATAKLFKVSTPTVIRYIQNLKGKLIQYVDDNIKNEDL